MWTQVLWRLGTLGPKACPTAGDAVKRNFYQVSTWRNRNLQSPSAFCWPSRLRLRGSFSAPSPRKPAWSSSVSRGTRLSGRRPRVVARPGVRRTCACAGEAFWTPLEPQMDSFSVSSFSRGEAMRSAEMRVPGGEPPSITVLPAGSAQ